ncbi:hem peroxidase [Dillenia turbinata]|uniref:Peroxidase n=1 Tax=Dillenia turbinata TaxID=194707 RepID=A0AAN8V4G7_9MAGN
MGASRGLILLTVLLILGRATGQLSENFYSSTCPNVEKIVQQAVYTKMSQTFITVPATLRLFFHDCFVEGCDASVMIAKPTGDAQKDAPENLSLAGDGFDTVIKAKQAVEAACPGVVSCADILALAARDVVVLVGGPSFNVELGRRDGLISEASRVAWNLPKPTFNLVQLKTLFAKNGLSQTDMIALSGAHTIGVSHCSEFAYRVYNFSASSPVDPSLNPNFAHQLMQVCHPGAGPGAVATFDPETPQIFDNVYYQNLLEGRGLLTSDEVLYTDPASRSTVFDFAKNASHFRRAFIKAMRKLGRVGIKTGNQGEIRRDCTTFNS